MAKQTYTNGFPLSSTPIHSLEDSGYFGSHQKKSFLKYKAVNACSPIKEYFIKTLTSKQKFIEQDSSECEDLKADVQDCTNITKSKLVFDMGIYDLAVPEMCTPSQISECKNINSFLHSYDESLSLDSLCSTTSFLKDDIQYELFPGLPNENAFTRTGEIRHLKRMKIDFLYELKQINCQSILSDILSYLSAKELCKASCVSKTWKKIISEDKNANHRKETFLQEQKIFLNGPSKENRLGMKFGPAREHKRVFSCLTNTYHTTEQISKHEVEKTRFDSFLSEAGGHTKLMKCPKCDYASKMLRTNIYVCTVCSHKFCCVCYDPVFETHKCHKPQVPMTVIGSKQSKKNLRRLKNT